MALRSLLLGLLLFLPATALAEEPPPPKAVAQEPPAPAPAPDPAKTPAMKADVDAAKAEAKAATESAKADTQKSADIAWVLVATAHPAKFNEIVEPIIGKAVDIPTSLQRLLSLPQHRLDLPPTLAALAAALE